MDAGWAALVGAIAGSLLTGIAAPFVVSALNRETARRAEIRTTIEELVSILDRLIVASRAEAKDRHEIMALERRVLTRLGTLVKRGEQPILGVYEDASQRAVKQESGMSLFAIAMSETLTTWFRGELKASRAIDYYSGRINATLEVLEFKDGKWVPRQRPDD